MTQLGTDPGPRSHAAVNHTVMAEALSLTRTLNHPLVLLALSEQEPLSSEAQVIVFSLLCCCQMPKGQTALSLRQQFWVAFGWRLPFCA